MASRSMLVVALAAAGCKHEEDGEVDGTNLGSDSVSAEVLERGVQTCMTAGERAANGPYVKVVGTVPPPSDPWIWHNGAIVADLDGDGWLDVATALEQGLELYAGSPVLDFQVLGIAVFGEFDLTFASGGSPVDYDGDGDLDLYITRIAGAPAPDGGQFGRNRLLRNDGYRAFTDVTDEALVDACGRDFRDGGLRCFRSQASSWGDVDADGDLDLFVGNYGFVDETNGVEQEDMGVGERDFLYLNDGDGTFTDVSDRLPPPVHESYTYAGGFHDLDVDGDLDLYLVNDFGRIGPNRVLWNRGDGTFDFAGSVRGDPPVQDGSGLDLPMTGMGLGIGDLNGDGVPDLAIPEWKRDTLLESRPDLGVWIGVGEQTGFTGSLVRDQWVGWGTEMGDLDNDGDLDIVNLYGHIETDNTRSWPNPYRQPDALYLNQSDGDHYSFVDVATQWGVDDDGMTRGIVLADINRDGWLDMIKRSLDQNNVVYLSRCGTEAWLTIDLEQPGTMNTRAIGARIEVVAGGRRWTRTIHSGGTGYASSPPPEAHFGLGDIPAIDELIVHWPDGEESVLPGVAPRQRITITRAP